MGESSHYRNSKEIFMFEISWFKKYLQGIFEYSGAKKKKRGDLGVGSLCYKYLKEKSKKWDEKHGKNQVLFI